MAKADEETAYKILEAVREIPRGKAASYGQIAEMAGLKNQARLVGRVLHYAEYYGDYPCHRVVNSNGRCAPGFDEQRSLLEEEGVLFKENGNVDMKKCQWKE